MFCRSSFGKLWWTRTKDKKRGRRPKIEVLEFTDAIPTDSYPVCLSGAMACPPDDCGGIHGYYYYLDVLKDKKHPEYKEIKNWMPRGFKTDSFDIQKINTKLSGISSYINRWRKRNL